MGQVGLFLSINPNESRNKKDLPKVFAFLSFVLKENHHSSPLFEFLGKLRVKGTIEKRPEVKAQNRFHNNIQVLDRLKSDQNYLVRTKKQYALLIKKNYTIIIIATVDFLIASVKIKKF